MPLHPSVSLFALAALLALPFAAHAQRSNLLDIPVPERPKEIAHLNVQQYGGACEVLFKREVQAESQRYYEATDSTQASTAHTAMRDLMARKHALNFFRATGMGIAPADVPVIQKAFQAPNMSAAGMKRVRQFCDQYADTVTAAVREHAEPEMWASYQADISLQAAKALVENAPKEIAGR